MPEPVPPRGRMVIAGFLVLFFGGIAAGSLHTAKEAYRWRRATFVRGSLVQRGTGYHFEYTPPGQAVVVGPVLKNETAPNDAVGLEYDPSQPEKLRWHGGRGKPPTNFQHFLLTGSIGSLFALAALWSLLGFFRAWSDSRTTDSLNVAGR